MTRAAFKAGLIKEGENWMEMIQSRNLTSYAYNEDTANQITAAIINIYFAEFQAKLTYLKQEKLG